MNTIWAKHNFRVKTSKLIRAVSIFAVLTCSSSLVIASEIEGEGEFGATISSGNSDTQNLLAKLKLSKKTGAWFNEVRFTAINSTESNATTAERYLL